MLLYYLSAQAQTHRRNKLASTALATMLMALTDGLSLRATCRLTEASRGGVLRPIAEVGDLCEVYQDQVFRKLPTKRVEADEQWSLCGAKQKNAKQEGHGDLLTFAAIDAESKLVFA